MRKHSILQRFTEKADLPGENLPIQPLVEICGDSRVLVENHRGVLEYTEHQIGIRVRFGAICVMGQDLRLCRMSSSQLVITGKIQGIYLKKG